MQCNLDPEVNGAGSDDDRAGDSGEAGDAAELLFDLQFNWRSHRFEAVVKRSQEYHCELTVTSDLGHLPFSAEGLQQRINIIAILRATQGGFPIRIDLAKSQKIKLTASAMLPAPVSAAAAIAGVTALLVQARPYLDMIYMMQPVSSSIRFRQ